jgi:DNA replication licensing factor MCM5
MEQQTISIAKAGITTTLNSRTSVIAAANPIYGRYDDLKHAAEQIDFQSSILSRFDTIFIVKDIREDNLDRQIAEHVLNLHMSAKTEESQGEIPMDFLRKYICYSK